MVRHDNSIERRSDRTPRVDVDIDGGVHAGAAGQGSADSTSRRVGRCSCTADPYRYRGYACGLP